MKIKPPTKKQIEDEKFRRKLTRSQFEFSKYFFKVEEGMDFIEAPFHQVLCDTLDSVFSGDIKRLIINIPPGYGKTQLAVIDFIARGLAINPKARFLHISYAQALALDNSSKAKDRINLEEFQALWPLRIRADTSAKGLWRTDKGGALRAASSGEPITGFRAGYADDTKFTGAMIIDDPLKPDDALSETERKKVNGRYTGVFKSRLMHEEVPVIVIMQRLHIDDFTANLLNGASGEKWHHLNLPVMNEAGEKTESFSHAIEIPNELPEGPLWSWKHDEAAIKVLKADEYTYAGQYQQSPRPLGGALFKSSMMEPVPWDDLPVMKYRFIVGDTAMTGKTHSDYSAFGCYGWGKDNRLYLLEMLRFKMAIPQMELAAEAFWKKHADIQDPKLRLQLGNLRTFLVENKSSGVGLIQRMQQKRMPVTKIEREKDKVARALDCLPYLAVSPIRLLETDHTGAEAEWIKDFESEVLSFTALGDAKNDDQVDTMMDAVQKTMIEGPSLMDVL